jgi:hypothetical protein
MENKNRVAYLDVSCELLANVLHLPAGSEIVRELPSPNGTDMRFVVRSTEFRTVGPGGEMPRANLAVKKTEDGEIVTSWYDL